jgi:phytol kinase
MPALGEWAGSVLRAAVWVVPVTFVYAVLAAELSGRMRARGVRTAYTRKVFHFLIFTAAAPVHLLAGFAGVLAFGGTVALVVLWAVWRGAGQPFYEALARPADEPRRSLFILVPLVTTALGGLFSNVLFGGYALVGYLAAGWGDALGEPVGARWGTHRYRVPSLAGVPAVRTLQGSAAVLGAGSAAAFVALVLLGATPKEAALAGAACGAACALVEAVSTHGLDNLTTQVATSAVAWLLV